MYDNERVGRRKRKDVKTQENLQNNQRKWTVKDTKTKTVTSCYSSMICVQSLQRLTVFPELQKFPVEFCPILIKHIIKEWICLHCCSLSHLLFLSNQHLRGSVSTWYHLIEWFILSSLNHHGLSTAGSANQQIQDRSCTISIETMTWRSKRHEKSPNSYISCPLFYRQKNKKKIKLFPS